MFFFNLFASLDTHSFPVCALSELVYRLSCESNMIPKNQPLNPPVTVKKLCMGPFKFPAKPLVSCNNLALLLLGFPVISGNPPTPCRPEGG